MFAAPGTWQKKTALNVREGQPHPPGWQQDWCGMGRDAKAANAEAVSRPLGRSARAPVPLFFIKIYVFISLKGRETQKRMGKWKERGCSSADSLLKGW